MIPVFKPSIKRKDMDSVLTCLVSDFIGYGEKTKEFLHLLTGFFEADHAYGFRDYSKGIGFALDSLDLEEGSRIVISPLSPAFYFTEITSRGFEVLYADITPSDACMDPAELQKLMDLKPAAVLLHFPLGNIPDLEELRAVDLPVIADISTAFGADYKGVPFSSFADILVLNLEAEGMITAGGGAAVFSSTRKYSAIMKTAAQVIPEISFLTDINSSLGLIQFNQKESFLEKREAIKEIFMVSLMKGRHKTFSTKDGVLQIPFSFPVLLEGHVREVRQYARKRGIRTHAAFEDSALARYQLDSFSCLNAGSILKRAILFPLYPLLSKKNIEIISKVLSTLP